MARVFCYPTNGDIGDVVDIALTIYGRTPLEGGFLQSGGADRRDEIFFGVRRL
jgi:hypothetical protein